MTVAEQCENAELMECIVSQSAVDEKQLQTELKECFLELGFLVISDPVPACFGFSSRCPHVHDFRGPAEISKTFFTPKNVENHGLAVLIRATFDRFSEQENKCLVEELVRDFEVLTSECLDGARLSPAVLNSSWTWPQLDDDGFIFNNIKRDVYGEVIRCQRFLNVDTFDATTAMSCLRSIEAAEIDGPRKHCLKQLQCSEEPALRNVMCRCAQFYGLGHESFGQYVSRLRRLFTACGLSFNEAYLRFKDDLKEYCSKEYQLDSAMLCILALQKELQGDSRMMQSMAQLFYGIDIKLNYIYLISDQFNCPVW